MKKPNITEGGWGLKYNGCYFDIMKSGFSIISTIQNEILESEIGLTEHVEFANAKAISAVPNLLDEAYSTYLMLNAHPQYVMDNDQEFIDRVNGLRKALIKAGFEL